MSNKPELPGTLRAEIAGAVAVLTLARPGKRNALSDETILGIEQFFLTLDPQVHAVVIDADGDHFCAGLDLAEMTERDTLAGGNAPQTNFAVLQVLPRIARSNPGEGFMMESLMAAIAQGTDDAKFRMREFLAGRAGKAGQE